MSIINSCVVSKIRSLKPGCASASPTTQTFYHARLLVFDKTLAQSHFVVVNFSDALVSVFHPLFLRAA